MHAREVKGEGFVQALTSDVLVASGVSSAEVALTGHPPQLAALVGQAEKRAGSTPLFD